MAKDDFLRELGEVTAEASALEYCVAYLVTLARSKDSAAVAQILRTNPREELKMLCTEVAASQDPAADWLGRELSSLHRRMRAAQYERNRMVHAVEVLRATEFLKDADLVLWHPKSDTELRVDTAQLDRLAADLRGIAGTALRLTHDARNWGASPPAP